MPEIAGEAAVLVNPESIDEIAESYRRISNNKEFALSLIEKGKLRRKDFSWDKTAENVWKSIEKTILNHNK